MTFDPDAAPWESPVPQAQPGPGDRPETALQGQTTVAERENGDAERAYTANLQLVGSFPGEGAEGFQMAWVGDFAYVPTHNSPHQEHPGTIVIDASDPARPHPTAYLTSPAMLDPHEALHVHPGRMLLAGAENTSFTDPLPKAMSFDVYDIAADPGHPVLLSSVEIPGAVGHGGNFTPDGRTFFVGANLVDGIYAIDLADPSNPVALPRIDERAHDFVFNADGTRAYIAHAGHFPPMFPELTGDNGLVILDVSDYQYRRPDPQARVVSRLYWEDGGGAHMQLSRLVTYDGRPYVVMGDEMGGGEHFGEGRSGPYHHGVAPDGFIRIIDVSDEQNPRVVSKLMLEVSDPRNAGAKDDHIGYGGYSSHYCGVDRYEDPRLLAATYRQAGVRVFDIRNPFRPREIAYYKPPLRTGMPLPGSWRESEDQGGLGTSTTDHSGSQVRFVERDGELHLWFTSTDNGFQVLRFTRPLDELLA
ncbi:hypothetical protein ABCS02_14185 [Microbacterium sp. X-17]|uniref:LVIVD repeat-containing protein n=1 Tax=Microbacterium sp. X-17 TaxID=3144404 RepID=UPI0031F4DBA7